MNKVDVYIGASTSKYWASLEFEDSEGVVHARKIEKDRDGTVNGNLIVAVTESFRMLNRPCMVDIHTRSEYIVEPFKNGWINNWERNDWKNAKGRTVRNSEVWKELRAEMERHAVRFLYTSDRRR